MRNQPTRSGLRLPARVLGVAALIAVLGGWVVFRVYSFPVATAPITPPAVTQVAIPAEPNTPKISAGESTPVITSLNVAIVQIETDDESAGQRPTIGTPDPDLDKLVERESAKEPLPKGKVRLDSIIRKASKRTPAAVAADVDAIIDRKLAEAGVPASPPADDAEFLRRAYLDIVGVIPSAAKVRSFLADPSTDKRTRLIEELLANEKFGQHFAHYWHDLLVKRDQDANKAIKTQDVFQKWMARQFNIDRPWDEVVRTMLTASGDQALAGETFFILANSENGQPAPNKIVGTASALFLGNQLMCCECHVHPVTAAWRPNDFWGLAAFFRNTRADRQVQSKNPNDVLARITDDPPKIAAKGDADKPAALPGGAIPIPDPRNEGKYIGAAMPRLLGGNPVGKAAANRKVFADWLVAPSNPFFARATVNRLWSQFFARGFINPLDDIRPDSESTHPEVLQLLAEEAVAAKFDVKYMIRCLVSTRAYQRSSRTNAANASDHDLYSHMAMKVLPPRSLFHSLAVATSEKIPMPGEDAPPAKKKEAPTSGIGFFDVREYDESPGEYTYGVPHLLRLMNAKLPPACDAMGLVANRLGSREKAIEHLYVTALSRPPTPAEVKKASEFVGKQPDPVKGYSTLAWALLSSAEFINNH